LRTPSGTDHVGHRGWKDGVVEEDALRVEIVRTDDDPAASGAHRRVGAVVPDDGDLAEGVARTHDDRAVHPDPHALEALVEVDSIRRRVEDAAGFDVAGRVVLDHLTGRHPAAGADHSRRRQRVPG
jgi:hypothetical protein